MPAVSTSIVTRKKPVIFRTAKKGSMQAVVQPTTNLAQQRPQAGNVQTAGMRVELSVERDENMKEQGRFHPQVPTTYRSAAVCAQSMS